jgi:hypothetical protein
MQKPSEDQITPDGRTFIGRKWITLMLGLWLLAFLIGAIVSAIYGLYIISAISLIFFGFLCLSMVLWVKSKS